MKIKTTFLFLFLSSFIYAQQTTVYVPVNSKLIKWKDFNYQKSLKGLGSLMKDVEKQDANLYQKMKPNYDLLLKQKKEANTALIGGSILGTLLMAIATESMLSTAGDITGPKKNKSDIGLWIASAAVFTGASLYYYKKSVKYQDILEFTNQFNEYSEGDKIEISLSPDFRWGELSSAGLALYIQF